MHCLSKCPQWLLNHPHSTLGPGHLCLPNPVGFLLSCGCSRTSTLMLSDGILFPGRKVFKISKYHNIQKINNIPANNIPKRNVAFVIISDYNDALLSPRIHGKTLGRLIKMEHIKNTPAYGTILTENWLEIGRRTLVQPRL